MSGQILTPKFLTEDVARRAVRIVVDIAINHPLMKSDFKLVGIQACHVVILVPSMFVPVDEDKYPHYETRPHVLYDESFSEMEKEKWEHDFGEIARCKALQLWHGRNDGRTGSVPHLLFPGDTPYWGGVKREGIVVACSGFQPYLDKMISGMIADLCIGFACHKAAEASEDTEKELDFLS